MSGEAVPADERAAMSVLVGLLEMDPYHLEALAELGRMLMHAGRVSDARTAFERVLRFDSGNQAAATALEALTVHVEN